MLQDVVLTTVNKDAVIVKVKTRRQKKKHKKKIQEWDYLAG